MAENIALFSFAQPRPAILRSKVMAENIALFLWHNWRMADLFSFNERGGQRGLIGEYLSLRERRLDLEHVPHPRQVGITWGLSRNPLITGFDNPAIDCCVLAVFGGNQAGVMHISPNTLPDDYTIATGERYSVSNSDVIKNYREILNQLENPQKIVVVSGDEGLARELERLASGQNSAFGKIDAGGEVTLVQLGTYGKEVIAVPESIRVYVAESQLGKFANGETIVKV